MKRLLCSLSLLIASSAWATPTACQSGPLSAYLSPGFSCQSGSLIFDDFGYHGTGPAADAVTVLPLTTFDKEGFQFESGWSVRSVNGASTSEDSTVTYSVHHVGGLIDTLALSFTSSVTGTGQSSVSESFCLGASLTNCAHEHKASVAVTDPGVGFSNRAFFAGVGTVSVSNEIRVDSGVNGTAAISAVSDTFSSPEPLSFVLLGTGLLGIGLMRRRLGRR